VSGVVTLGETMGLFTASSIGSLTHADQFRLGIGGAESNVAIGLARLGTPSTWIGRVGADEVGDLILRELRAEGVAVRATSDATAQTAVMVKNRRTAHHTRVLYYRSASAGSRLSPEDIDAELIADADVVHITGITPALSASAASAVSHAIDIAESAGVPVSFDVNHRTALWSAGKASEVYRSLAARATIVFAGLDEAAMVSDGSSAAELAAGIAALGASEVVIKLGREGCFALIEGQTFTVPAIPVVAIDTVGAGDAFVAGYLAERCAGAVPMARLTTGVQAGAFACLGLGDWESLPTRSDLTLLARDEPVER
jgi:2-dehydro-3-deoxygluconokinase